MFLYYSLNTRKKVGEISRCHGVLCQDTLLEVHRTLFQISKSLDTNSLSHSQTLQDVLIFDNQL